MAKLPPQLNWCIVRLGKDMNWWVTETSDPIHWDTDGLSILDPRQVSHMLELCEPLRDYGFDLDLVDHAFFTFRIDKEVKDGHIRLIRLRDSLLTSEEKLFALPDILNEDKSPYAELLDELIKARTKLLNDTLSLEQPLTTDEIEEILQERAGSDYIEGRALHIFTELDAILEYVPDGFEDEMDDHKSAKTSAADDIPDVEEEQLEQDETMRWGDEDEKDKDVDDELDEGDEDEDEDDFDDEDEDVGEKSVRKPTQKTPIKKPSTKFSAPAAKGGKKKK